MKDLAIWLSYAISVGAFVLALYFFQTQSKHPVRRAMGFLALTTSLWVLATTIGAYNDSASFAEAASRWTYVFGCFMVSLVFIFASQFPFPTFELNRWNSLFILMPAVILSPIILSTPTIIDQYAANFNQQGVWLGGNLYWLYNTYLLALYITAVSMLVMKLRRVDGHNRTNLKLVTWSILLGGLPGVVNDLVIPLFSNSARQPFIGTISTIIWLGVTSYILVKK